MFLPQYFVCLASFFLSLLLCSWLLHLFCFILFYLEKRWSLFSGVLTVHLAPVFVSHTFPSNCVLCFVLSCLRYAIYFVLYFSVQRNTVKNTPGFPTYSPQNDKDAWYYICFGINMACLLLGMYHMSGFRFL